MQKEEADVTMKPIQQWGCVKSQRRARIGSRSKRVREPSPIAPKWLHWVRQGMAGTHAQNNLPTNDDGFEDSFPSIDDGDIDEEMESNKLKTSGFQEKMRILQEQIRTSQQIRESLSADIDRKAKELARYKEEKESDVMKLKVYDPYNDILATQNDTNNLSGSNRTNAMIRKEQIKDHSREELARMLGKSTNLSRVLKRDKAIMNRVFLHHLGGRFNHLPEGLASEDKNNSAFTANSTQAVVRVRTGDRAVPELKFYAIPGYTFTKLHEDVCHFYGVPADEYEVVGVPDGTKFPSDICIEEEFSQLFQSGECLVLNFCQKVSISPL